MKETEPGGREKKM